MIKIIPHASNNFTVELDNGDQFEFMADRNHLDISIDKGDMVVRKYDYQSMEWDTVMREHSIRLTKP